MLKAKFLALTLIVALPALAQSAIDFSKADSFAEQQLTKDPDATSAYATAWAEFNNQHKLDERDGCFFKATGELTQILEIDVSGKVIGYYSDKENGRSRCWSDTYMGVVFPKPPFAPYWHKLVMH